MSAVGLGIDAFGNYTDPNQTFMQATGNTLNSNKFLLAGAALGSVIPGLGTAIGAGIGGLMDFFFSDGIISHGGKIGRVAETDSIMAFNEDRYMKALSKRSGIYGFANQSSSKGMDFDYDKFGKTMFRVMNGVKWDQRTTFDQIVRTSRATTW